MTYFIFILLYTWFVITAIYQFSDHFRNKLSALPFNFFGLLPNWRLFCPKPVLGSYVVYYRVMLADKKNTTQWKMLNTDPKISIPLIYNPETDLYKTISNYCSKIKSTEVEYTNSYLLLLNHISAVCRQEFDPKKGKAIQFKIIWENPLRSKIKYTSFFHELY